MKKLLTVIAICLCTGIFTGCFTMLALMEEASQKEQTSSQNTQTTLQSTQASVETAQSISLDENEIVWLEVDCEDFINISTEQTEELFKTQLSEEDINKLKNNPNLFGFKIPNTTINSVSDEDMTVSFPNVSQKQYLSSNECKNYIAKMNKTDPTWKKRITNEHFNGKYKLLIHCPLNNKDKISMTLIGIEGIPTQEQIDEAETKAEIESKKQLDAVCQKISEGYIFHGADEESDNIILICSGAMEKGHAYYVSCFAPYEYAPSSMARVFNDAATYLFANDTAKPFYVNYKNSAVKAKVMKATYLYGSYLPCSVIIAAPEDNWDHPTVLDIVTTSEK